MSINFGCLSNVPSFDKYPTFTYSSNTLIFTYANVVDIERMSQSPLIVAPTAFNVEEYSVKICESQKAEVLCVTTRLGQVVAAPARKRNQNGYSPWRAEALLATF